MITLMLSRASSSKVLLKFIIVGIIVTVGIFIFFQVAVLKSSTQINRSIIFPEFPLPGNCKMLQNVFFLKTIKTGGTTVQKIFYQFGDKYGLNFGMPFYDDYLGYPRYLNMSTMSIPVPFNETYNIVANHCRFSRQAAQAAMPSNTIYVTLLRDPVSQFKSMFSYFDFSRITNHTIHQYLSLSDQQRKQWPRFFGKFGRNQMAFDLGMSMSDFDNPQAVEPFLKHIEDSFHLVMIAERMDESVVLLRHLLCWPLDEVFHFDFNIRTNCKKPQSPLSVAEENVIRRWNAIDQRLYDHFLSVFDRKVEQFGRQRLNRELAEFRYWNTRVKKICVNETDGELKRDTCDLVLWYYVKDDANEPTCHRLALMPTVHNAQLRDRQLKRVKDINSQIKQSSNKH